MSEKSLTELLVSSSEGVRGLDDAVLIELLKSENEMAAWYAIKAVGALTVSDAVPHLLAILADEPDPPATEVDKRSIAAWSLAKFPYSDIGQLLLDRLKSGNELERMGIVDTFGEMRAQETLVHLLRAVATDTYQVALWATLSLSKLGKKARPGLQDLLEVETRDPQRILISDAISKIDNQYT